MPKSTTACPAKTCAKPDAPQEAIASGLLASAGVNAAWTAQARRCTQCGCVYSVEDEALTVRGYYNNPIFPEGWRPIYV